MGRKYCRVQELSSKEDGGQWSRLIGFALRCYHHDLHKCATMGFSLQAFRRYIGQELDRLVFAWQGQRVHLR